MILETKLQIGKNGITEGTLESLENALKTHKRVRISVFKSSGRDRESIKFMASELQSKLKTKVDFKIIGFTIILFRRGANKS
jgi:RNA-binding protein YhbY